MADNKIKNFKEILLCFSLLSCMFITTLSYSQAYQWAKGIGGTLGDQGSDIAVDASNNVYTAGLFWQTADFDPGSGVVNLTSAGNRDVFVTKMNAGGNLIWAKRMGGVGSDLANAMALDPNGNVYTTGQYIGTADFDPGPGVFNLTPVGNVDIFISKLDNNGNFVWAKRIGSTANDFSYGIAADAGGNVYIAGNLTGSYDFDPGPGVFNLTSAGGDDAFILKLDVNGNFVWAINLGDVSSDNGGPIALDAAGNVYVTGIYAGSVDFDPGPGITYLNSAGSVDCYMCKYSPAGNLIWAKSLGGTLADGGKSISTDNTGNVYITGSFKGTADFDPDYFNTYNLTSSGYNEAFIGKYNNAGDLIWVKSISGPTGDEFAQAITTDPSGNVFTNGYYGTTCDFDPGAGTYNLTPVGGWDGFTVVLDPSGNFLNAQTFGGLGSEYSFSIAADNTGKAYITGFFDNTVSFIPPSYLSDLNTMGGNDIFIAKYISRGVIGYIYNDISQNCNKENIEPGLAGRNAIINPGNIIVQTDMTGGWYIDSLAAGSYTITYDTSGHWSATCPVVQNFVVINPDAVTNAPNFGLVSTMPCAQPDVSVVTPVLRRCFSNQKIYVRASNSLIATGALNSAYVELQLDSMFTPTSASLPYINLGAERYRFNLGNINPGQYVNFWMNTTLSCDAIIGQTLCVHADLYPADSCVFDTIAAPAPADFVPCSLPWDKSSISVDGWCSNNTIYFIITNTGVPGNGDMDCFAPMRLYIDGQYIWLDSIQLNGGETDTLVFTGDGRTWRLEVDQHPLHPGNSHPNATVELCGNIDNWTPNLVNILPPDDADPVVDIYCGLVTGSFDPNDKTGYPLGVGVSHTVSPNGQLDYLIRFQNTGTDTAFTVVIRDTLDTDLDIFTVVSGASSHNYTFNMYGPRVLEWTFNNIMLPDSTADEPGSHGFIAFTVKQEDNLPDGTEINNTAHIYFDFNSAVITNTTSHHIGRDVQQAGWSTQSTVNAVACDNYTYNGYTYNQTGSYWQVKSGTGGADTLITINVTIKNSTYSSMAASACNSYTAPDGTIHTTSGIKTAVIPNTIGCDSVITINLTILSTSSEITEIVCNSYTAPDGNVYTTTGNQTAVIPNSAGCDSIITIHLTIYTSLDIDTSVTQSGTTLTSNSVLGNWQWINCSDNMPISGETGQTFTATSNGSYAVIIGQGACQNTSSCYDILGLGIVNGSFGTDFKISPNPTSGEINVEMNEEAGLVDLIVTNALGQEVLKQQFKNASTFSINIDSNNGIYFLRIISGTSTTNFKIIKE
jgi:uncharacterized repeat protein (TIGR01451 family)